VLINVNTECSVMLYFLQTFLLRLLFEFYILYAPIFSLTLCTLCHCVVLKIAVNILDALGLHFFFFFWGLIYSHGNDFVIRLISIKVHSTHTVRYVYFDRY
jgi:hypothetical protein